MKIPRLDSDMVSTRVVLALIICKVFFSRKVFDVKFFLFNRVCNPEESHFHGPGTLTFDGVVGNAKAIGFDVTQLTQDEEQSLFTIKTNMPIPMVVFGNSFQWAKYGHLILPSNLDLKSNNKAGLHETFWNCLIDFPCTDLDGNLSSTLNPLITSKLDHYVSKKLRDCQKLQIKEIFLINIC